MGSITVVLLCATVTAVMAIVQIFKGMPHDSIHRTLGYVKSIGFFGLIVGILGQMIGLYGAFQAIEEAGEVSQALLAGGIKISSITTIYGMIVCVLCYTFYFVLSLVMSRRVQ